MQQISFWKFFKHLKTFKKLVSHLVGMNFYPQTFSCFLFDYYQIHHDELSCSQPFARITDLRPISGHNQFFYNIQANGAHIFAELKKKTTRQRRKAGEMYVAGKA